MTIMPFLLVRVEVFKIFIYIKEKNLALFCLLPFQPQLIASVSHLILENGRLISIFWAELYEFLDKFDYFYPF